MHSLQLQKQIYKYTRSQHGVRIWEMFALSTFKLYTSWRNEMDSESQLIYMLSEQASLKQGFSHIFVDYLFCMTVRPLLRSCQQLSARLTYNSISTCVFLYFEQIFRLLLDCALFLQQVLCFFSLDFTCLKIRVLGKEKNSTIALLDSKGLYYMQQ